MGNQTPQRLDLVSQAADACQKWLQAYLAMSALQDRAPFMGTLTDAELLGTNLQYLDAATVNEFFTNVFPEMRTWYTDTANTNRRRRVLNHMAPRV